MMPHHHIVFASAWDCVVALLIAYAIGFACGHWVF
jgi:hypothetical protein